MKNVKKQRINLCNQLTQHSKELIAMSKNFTNKKENKLYDNKSNYRIKEP